MTTQNLIEASATIIRVTNLKKGNAYKRLEEGSYSETKLVFGIVTDILNNGEDCVIQSVEFDPSYRGLSTKIKVFGKETDLKIFPANPEEVSKFLNECLKSCKENLVDKQKHLHEAETLIKSVSDIISGEIVSEITAPEMIEG